ncbi:LamG domain-containing protein [endosymbiont of Lamellibrachia barhami]|uniref:LamG domain-containing protein n=1 Tax=endosymbiont of Lamellibrachia barhami TaxID=205975 RepID=UPI0015AEC674|nr:LamG domain-containing protein [endosymbiont of Lamellibrachia barhami]
MRISKFTALATALLISGMVNADLSGSLVADYPFNGNAIDETYHGYDGTIHGGAALTFDRFGTANSAYNFDGSSGYIEIGTSLNFPSWPSYSVSLWFLNDGGGDWSLSYGQKIIDKTTPYHDFYLSLGPVNPPRLTGEIRFKTHEGYGGVGIDGTYLFDSTADFRDSTWHHVVINKNGSHGELWVDGELSESADDVKTVYNNTSLLFGYSLSSHGYQRRYWSGDIDDIRVYDQAISEVDVKRLHMEGVPPADMLTDVVQTIVTLNIQEGLANSLDAKLDSAIGALDDVNTDNDVSAVNRLYALISAIEAQRGKKITDTDADLLIAATHAVIEKLLSE